MLVDLIRKVVPIRYRQSIGLWTARQASRSKVLLYPYMFLLCGTTPRGLVLLPNSECQIMYKGHSILAPRDSVFTAWEVLQDCVYEKEFTVEEGDTVFDVGAHVGLFTVKAALQVGNRGRVVAVEPVSANVKYLRSNTANIPEVAVISAAAGASVGVVALTLSTVSSCHSAEHVQGRPVETVSMSTLDDIAFRLKVSKVDFLKIDAEGYEVEILKGAGSMLRNGNMKVAIAAYHNLPTGEPELPQVCQILSQYRFKCVIRKEYVYATK